MLNQLTHICIYSADLAADKPHSCDGLGLEKAFAAKSGLANLIAKPSR
jgi:hypothetical protein